jgi:hypothetical protein
MKASHAHPASSSLKRTESCTANFLARAAKQTMRVVSLPRGNETTSSPGFV